ncbi:hypothetical protein BC831DRAFT_489774 [Entophlyctis helioformis]|nr:hypothetical protein BC831DRAFT_489774 [Entophlyctis helioformis]
MDLLQSLLAFVLFAVFWYFLAKFLLLPAIIQYVVKIVPLDKELTYHSLALKSITDHGVQASLDVTILDTNFLPMNMGTVVVRLVSPVRVYDALLGDLWAETLIQSPIIAGGPPGTESTDVRVKLDHVEVVLGESMEALKQVVRRVVIGGQKEVERISVRVDMTATIDICGGLMVLDAVPLTKTINIGELIAIKVAAERKRKQDAEKRREKLQKQMEKEVQQHLEEQQKLEEEEARKQGELEKELREAQETVDYFAETVVQDDESGSELKPFAPADAVDAVAAASGAATGAEKTSDADAEAAAAATAAAAPAPAVVAPPAANPEEVASLIMSGQFESIDIKQFVSRTGSYGIPTINRAAIDETVHAVVKEALTGVDSLIPVPVITPLPVTPLMRSINGGLDIVFPTPPNLTYKLGSVRFHALLNGSRVAQGTIRGLEMSNERTNMTITVEIVPAMTSEAPVRGLASTAKGMLTGAVKGALNGFLYGDWGAGATIVGVTGLQVENEEGRMVAWMEELLSVVEIEYDIDAVRKVGSTAAKATGSLKESVLHMAVGVVDAARRSPNGGSRCSIM